MKLETNKSGDFTLRIQDDVSAIMLQSATKITAGQIEVELFTSQGKTTLVNNMDILHFAELANAAPIILKTAESNVVLPLSNNGNIALAGEDYIQVTFRGLTAAGANQTDIHVISNYFSNDTANIVRTELSFDGAKAKNVRVDNADFLSVEVNAALQSVELRANGRVIKLDIDEIKAVNRSLRREAFYIQETTSDAYWKNHYLIPLQGAEQATINSDGTAALTIGVMQVD